MKKLIFAILILCTFFAGCSAQEMVEEPLAIQTPVLSNTMVSENTKVTQPTLHIKKEPEKQVPSEEQVVDEATASVKTEADQLAEPKAAEEKPTVQ